MKKIAVLLLVAIGCKKTEEPPLRCYECEMTYADGMPAGTQFPCTTNLASWQTVQADNSGRPIRSVCREK